MDKNPMMVLEKGEITIKDLKSYRIMEAELASERKCSEKHYKRWMEVQEELARYRQALEVISKDGYETNSQDIARETLAGQKEII